MATRHAEKMMQITADAFFDQMAAAVARERGRCRAIADNAADLQLAQGNADGAAIAQEIAELIAGGSDLSTSTLASTEITYHADSYQPERRLEDGSERATVGEGSVGGSGKVGERSRAAIEEEQGRQREDAEEAEYRQAVGLVQFRD